MLRRLCFRARAYWRAMSLLALLASAWCANSACCDQRWVILIRKACFLLADSLLANDQESISLENNEENRMKWRNLLFTTPELGEYVSGAILFEETLFQKDPTGTPFVDVLNKAGIIPGIKVDKVIKY
jgi:hypothetical protein